MREIGPCETMSSPPLDDIEDRRGLTAARLTGPEKVAVLLLGMGLENAERFARQFTEDELKCLAQPLSRLRGIPQADFEAIVDELQASFEPEAELKGSREFTNELFRAALSADSAEALLSEIFGLDSEKIWEQLEAMEPDAVVQLIGDEHPQVVAFVLTRLSSDLAAKVLAGFDRQRQIDLGKRILNARMPPQPALSLTEERLVRKLQDTAGQSDETNAIRLSAVLNRIDKETADAIVDKLQSVEPERAKEVRRRMFRFSDLTRLEISHRRKVVEELETEDLIKALSICEETTREVILEALYGRARRTVEQELSLGSKGNEAEALETQQRIASLALDMIDRGLVELADDQ
jgi:flagellar motor switch protein FliG